MRKLFFLFIFSGLSTFSFAQKLPKKEVPSVVLNQFQIQFPKAFDIEWEKTTNGYKVEFDTKRSKDHEVWYSIEGKVLKHKEELSERNLPQTIINYIENNYKGYKIDDVDKITEKGKVVYQIEVEKRANEIILRFDEKGNLTP